MQRIYIGNQVATHTIGINQLHHARLSHGLLVQLVFTEKERITIDIPAQWRIGNIQIAEDLIVEVMFAHQQFMNTRQKRPRLSALHQSMIVSAADGYRFADAEL